MHAVNSTIKLLVSVSATTSFSSADKYNIPWGLAAQATSVTNLQTAKPRFQPAQKTSTCASIRWHKTTGNFNSSY